MLKRFLRTPMDDTLATLEHLMTQRRSGRALALMLVTTIVAWHVYVPIHELLHVGGCVFTGGEVSQLEMQARYGATILQHWFPFITTGGDYAGRLSGFNTHNNDGIYMATVFGPFLLSVLIGVPLMRVCTRRRRPLLTGPAFMVGLAPFYNLPGDYFEMASILITRLIAVVTGDGASPVRFAGLRSDDIFTLIPDVLLRPTILDIGDAWSARLFALLVVAVCVMFSVVLAFATYRLGDLVARAFVGKAPVFKLTQQRAGAPAHAP